VTKSSILCPEGVALFGGSIAGVPLVAPDHYFRVLGGNVTDKYDDFVEKKIASDNVFFDMLLDFSGDLHPQVVFAMLRLCGAGRLVFLCCTAPPHVSSPICANFKTRVEQVVKSIAGIAADATLSDLSKRLINDRAGLGMPDYPTAHRNLHIASKSFALDANRIQKRRTIVPLVTSERVLPTLDVQLGTWANDWMFFSGGVTLMSHHKFQLALAIRIRANPLATELSFCACHARINSQQHFIEHAFSCSRASNFSFDKRHDGVKYALFNTARRYGIRATLEPSFYNYDDDAKRRPDITFYTPTPTVVDVTVVLPNTLHDGPRAAAKAREKINKHRKAVARMSHHFVPWVMETFGHFDATCETVINRLALSLPDYMHYDFKKDMIHEASTALADGLATAPLAAHYQVSKSTQFP
jgi:hypothetical protein